MKSKILDYVDFERANSLLEGFTRCSGNHFNPEIADIFLNQVLSENWDF